jgi:hypothetical protein
MVPTFRITQNDSDITAGIAERLESLTVSDKIGWGTDSMTLALNDANGDLDIPRRGARLKLYLGYDGQPLALIGEYSVDRVSVDGPPDKVTIQCAGAALMDADGGESAWQTKKSRSWEPLELGIVVDAIAQEHKVASNVSNLARLTVLPHMDQDAESDMQFLQRICLDRDMILKVNVSTLAVMTRNEAPLDGLAVTPDDVATWTFDFGNRVRYNKVVTVYHSDRDAAQIECTAGTGAIEYRHPQIFVTEIDAQGAANGYLASYQRGGATFSFTMPGRTDIQADTVLTLDGFARASINGGGWRVENVEHKIDSGGYSITVSGTNRNALDAEPATDNGFEGLSEEGGEAITDNDGREPITT